MPSPLVLAKRVPWVRVWLAAQWLYHQGRRRLEQNLTEGERAELFELMRRSKGRRANLSKRQQHRLTDLVKKGVRGS